MAWRVLHITNPTFLCLEKGKIIIKQKEDQVALAIEDVACIVLDHWQISMTLPLLNQLASAKVVVLVCSEKHVPSGIFFPYVGHSRLLESFEYQQSMSVPQKKGLWQQMIKAKLSNQAKVIAAIGKPKEAVFLTKLSAKTRSGDIGNTEAIGAKYYWKILFGKDFVRSKENVINVALNYGYALIRSLLVRSLAAGGYYLPMGIHHKSQLNPFNLADDFMEPYRPFVDLFVFQMKLGKDEVFEQNRKRKLTEVLQMSCHFDGMELIVLNACEKSAESFYRTLRLKKPLVSPEIR